MTPSDTAGRRNGKRAALPVALAFLSFSAGCVSIGSGQAASTLGHGKFELSVEPAYFGSYGAGNPAHLPAINVRGQYGLLDRVDVGVRLGGTGGELIGKVQLTSRENERFVLSLAPSTGGTFLASTTGWGGMVFAQLPVLVGFKVGQGHELVLGPRIHDWLVFGGSDGMNGWANLFSLGGSVGMKLRLTERVRLYPEVAVLYHLTDTLDFAGVRGTAIGGSNGVLLQVSLGTAFGN